MQKFFYILLLLTITLVACGGQESGGGDAATAVESYFQAKIVSNEATIRGLLCSDMEQFAEREVLSFKNVQGVKIEGMSCTDTGNGRVSCQGKIVALYGSEESEFPLTTYQAVQEDGQWKWCGETK